MIQFIYCCKLKLLRFSLEIVVSGNYWILCEPFDLPSDVFSSWGRAIGGSTEAKAGQHGSFGTLKANVGFACRAKRTLSVAIACPIGTMKT